MTTKSELARKLNNLPVEVGKVTLWFVYRNLKPMTTISLNFNWEENEEQQNEILSWLKQAGLYFEPSQRFPEVLHISSSEKILEENKQYELDESRKAHKMKGKFYGIPDKAAEVFATNVNKGDEFPGKQLAHAFNFTELEGKYWLPYAEYLVRTGHEIEDASHAKKRADLARAEIPEVAHEYERKRLESTKKLKTKLT